MSDEALASFRAEFAEISESAIELREEAREAMLEMAGRETAPQTDTGVD